MAAHTQAQREWIVRRLAGFATPKVIAAQFCAIFADTSCNENDVLANDPRLTVLPPDLHALFYAERERVLEDPRSAPMADQKARLIALSNQVEHFERNNQPGEARVAMRQIAEELGIVGGKSGGNKPGGDADKDKVDITAIEVVRTIVHPKSDAGTE